MDNDQQAVFALARETKASGAQINATMTRIEKLIERGVVAHEKFVEAFIVTQLRDTYGTERLVDGDKRLEELLGQGKLSL